MNTNKDKIKFAIELLTNHSQEDFVSKADALTASNALKDILNDIDISTSNIYTDIQKEVFRATEKHPNWPEDKVYAATIVSEENGELTRACLQYMSEDGELSEVKTEAIHTAATCVRLLLNL